MAEGADQPGLGGSPTGIRRVEQVMGTIVSIDVRDPAVEPTVVERALQVLHDADDRYSPFQADSELSRLARGDVAEAACSTQLRGMLVLADDLCRASGGYFDVRRHRADGRLDPSGLVKGWAAEAAARVLDEAGLKSYCLNVGGDVITRGAAEAGRAWRVGIRHPRDGARIATVLAVRNMAVATSGGYERGDHIVDPHTGRPSSAWLSMTVAGPSLTYADAYATAAFAMGRTGIAWVAAQPGYGAYAIDSDEVATWTEVVERLRAPSSRSAEP
jgi:FAD:protein FMN transferase